MAAWTTITTGTQYLTVSIINEILYSMYVRGLFGTANPTITTGENVQLLSRWLDIQQRIDNISTADTIKYLVPTGFATPGANSGFTRTEFVDEYAMSSADIYTLAGITGGFRRATSWPTDWTNLNDAAFSHGLMQRGDIIGPWIIEDLRLCLDKILRIMKFGCTGASASQSISYNSDGGVTGASSIGSAGVSVSQTDWEKELSGTHTAFLTPATTGYSFSVTYYDSFFTDNGPYDSADLEVYVNSEISYAADDASLSIASFSATLPTTRTTNLGAGSYGWTLRRNEGRTGEDYHGFIRLITPPYSY